jgi:hypothetical protein
MTNKPVPISKYSFSGEPKYGYTIWFKGEEIGTARTAEVAQVMVDALNAAGRNLSGHGR